MFDLQISVYEGALLGCSTRKSGLYSGPLWSPWIGLLVSPTQLQQGLTVASMPQPVYPGYGQQFLTWQTFPFRREGDNLRLLTSIGAWQMADSSTPTTICGAFFATGNSPPSAILGVENWDNPVVLLAPDDALALCLVLQFEGNVFSLESLRL